MSLVKKIIQAEIEANKRIEKENNKKLFRWQTKVTIVIKEKLEKRKKLGLKNDWKIKFYEDKLKIKSKLLSKLSRLIK